MRVNISILVVGVALASVLFFFVIKDRSVSTVASLSSGVFSQAESALPDSTWSKPVATTENTSTGNVSGEKITTTLKSKEAMLTHFENVSDLKQMGFTQDSNLSADGPGSSVWGYKNPTTNQVILYSYNTKPTSSNPNEPLSFNCPCEMSVSVFVSNPSSMSSAKNAPGHNIANPASTNCQKVGGVTIIKTMGNGGQYGLCQFEDNMACEEWALFNGDCPVGGIKTTGYDTIQQMYCAWLGGKTLAVENPTCTLPNGTICTDEAVYNGTCTNSN